MGQMSVAERVAAPCAQLDTDQANSVEIIPSISSIREQWQELGRRAAPCLFQSQYWCQAWVEASEQAGLAPELFLLVIRAGTALAMVWPLAIRRTAFGRVLHGVAEPATQYCDALMDPQFASAPLLRLAWNAIVESSEIDLVELRRVRSDSCIVQLPVIASGRAAKHHVTTSPAIVFAGDVHRRSGRTYNALRKHERMLGRHGEVAFEIISDSEAKATCVAEMMKFKHEWMRERGLWSAGYSHPANVIFNEALVKRPEFLVARLRVGEVTAAVEAGIVDRGHYWSLMQGYDSRFAEHGPGRLLTWHFIDWCPKEGIQYFDFLAPTQPHKTEWANRQIPVADYVIPLTARGRIAAFNLLHAKPLAKRAFAVLPIGIRRHAVSWTLRDSR